MKKLFVSIVLGLMVVVNSWALSMWSVGLEADGMTQMVTAGKMFRLGSAANKFEFWIEPNLDVGAITYSKIAIDRNGGLAVFWSDGSELAIGTTLNFDVLDFKTGIFIEPTLSLYKGTDAFYWCTGLNCGLIRDTLKVYAGIDLGTHRGTYHNVVQEPATYGNKVDCNFKLGCKYIW